jgi:hypothetical protein
LPDPLRVAQISLDANFNIINLPAPPRSWGVQSAIGDVYYLKLADRKFEFAHPFSTFMYEREAGKKFELNDSLDQVTAAKSPSSSVSRTVMPLAAEVPTLGVLVRVHEASMCRRSTFTSDLRNWASTKGSKEDYNGFTTLTVCGPYRRVYRRLEQMPQQNPYILIATSTGVSFIMDYVFWVRQQPDVRMQRPVHIMFSTPSRGLLEWVSNIVFRAVHTCPSLSATCFLTARDVEQVSIETKLVEEDSSSANKLAHSAISAGRFEVETMIQTAPKDTEVYFCGAEIVHNLVLKYCRDYGLQMFAEVPYI